MYLLTSLEATFDSKATQKSHHLLQLRIITNFLLGSEIVSYKSILEKPFPKVANNSQTLKKISRGEDGGRRIALFKT